MSRDLRFPHEAEREYRIDVYSAINQSADRFVTWISCAYPPQSILMMESPRIDFAATR